jgi:cyclophilin family peptidyl-prolyl cis-trans isomerase
MGKECKWGSIGVKAKANARRNPRPRCFLALGSSEQFYGKVTFELFAKECPMTAENFRGLCTGEYGLSYKCSSIHRIVKDILWQGGDVTGQGGSGSKSIFGDHFPDENFTFKHDQPGVLSMANSGPDTNGSQFMISAKRLSVLDGKNVVFGRVTGGMNVLQKLFNEVTSSGKPKKKIFIVECGELDVNEDTRTEEGDSEEIEELDLEDSGEEPNTSISEPLTYDTEEEK